MVLINAGVKYIENKRTFEEKFICAIVMTVLGYKQTFNRFFLLYLLISFISITLVEASPFVPIVDVLRKDSVNTVDCSTLDPSLSGLCHLIPVNDNSSNQNSTFMNQESSDEIMSHLVLYDDIGDWKQYEQLNVEYKDIREIRNDDNDGKRKRQDISPQDGVHQSYNPPNLDPNTHVCAVKPDSLIAKTLINAIKLSACDLTLGYLEDRLIKATSVAFTAAGFTTPEGSFQHFRDTNNIHHKLFFRLTRWSYTGVTRGLCVELIESAIENNCRVAENDRAMKNFAIRNKDGLEVEMNIRND